MEITPELIAALSTGIVTIITALTTLIIALRTKQQVEKDAIVKDKKLQELHVLVNGRFTKALEEIADLRESIAAKEGSNSNKALAEKARDDAIKSADVAASVETKTDKV